MSWERYTADMDIGIIAQFAIATLLPVAACAVLTALRQRAGVAKLPERNWQAIVGVVFGLIAIYGTEAGIPVDGAMMNVRDAAPIAAGLFFGGPAGIIAGVIGGVERWLAVMWGVGQFTQVACTLGTIFAGAFAAALRKYVFSYHIPNLSFAFATGVVAEVLHLTLVFVTNLDQAARAFEVVQLCVLPMTLCVGLSTLISSFVLHLMNRKPLLTPLGERNVVRILHNRMLIAIVAAFLLTVGFTAIVQTNRSVSDAAELLELSVEDVYEDIVDASDANLLGLTQRAAAALPDAPTATDAECARLAAELDVAEINVVNGDGIITASNNPAFIGFDMASGEQSAAFLALLPGGGQTQLVQSYQPIAYDAGTSMKYAGVAVEGGFVQVGYDASSFLDDLSSQVEASVRNRHVGQTGAFVAVDETGTVLSTREDIANEQGAQLVADAKAAGAGRVFTTQFAGEECFAFFQEVEGYRLIALLPTAEAYSSRDSALLIVALMEVLVFAALFLVIHAVIKLVVVRGVRRMTGQLADITKGDLDVEVDVRTASEFSSLSDDINKTVGTLKASLAVVKADLDMAASIQANTLPDITSALAARPEFDLLGTMEPAKEVGGDFYDFFLVDDDHLALVVADVSGKGVPAALFMMQSKIVIKMEALSGTSPEEVMRRANADLAEKNEEGMFTTAWLGILELSTGTLTYADAGHEKLALYHGGSWELPPKPNGAVALAVFSQEDFEELADKYKYRSHTVVLQPGDGIFQYTDGVTEATNASDEIFGEDRLVSALNEASGANPGEVLPLVRRRIDEFVADAPQFDDITMLGLMYKGTIASGEAHESD
ncbi:MAG: SpoIIE family protein phosphatase [Eggerthellaceae bacterium]|nr:SpoIIE family protein phosphatase [Eggerthellaceae bacterium]